MATSEVEYALDQAPLAQLKFFAKIALYVEFQFHQRSDGEESPHPQTRSQAHDIKYLPIEHPSPISCSYVDWQWG